MDINPTTATSSTATASSANSSDASLITSDFEFFLEMLTAQAKYQDPLDPMDNTEYAAQLATFSSVEQQVKTNDLLTAMTDQLASTNMAEYASWIGLEARTTAPTYFDGRAVTITPNPAGSAQEMDLVVFNTAGEEVQRKSYPVSTDPFEWNGVADDGTTLAAGSYAFQIESRAQGKVIASDPVPVYARVTEARTEGSNSFLVLEGDAEISVADVTALREAS